MAMLPSIIEQTCDLYIHINKAWKTTAHSRKRSKEVKTIQWCWDLWTSRGAVKWKYSSDLEKQIQIPLYRGEKVWIGIQVRHYQYWTGLIIFCMNCHYSLRVIWKNKCEVSFHFKDFQNETLKIKSWGWGKGGERFSYLLVSWSL